MESITSQRNPRIQLIRSLRQRKERQETGLFVVEGTFHIGLALDQKASIEFVVYADELLSTPFSKELIGRITQAGIPCFQTTRGIFESLGSKENPHGTLAVAQQRLTAIAAYAPSANSISVALQEPADPGNLGSILRTLDAVGGEALILVDGGVDPYHPTAVRAGLGAHFCHPIMHCSFAEFGSWDAQHKVHTIGTSPDSGSKFRQMAAQRPAVLYLGSERDGLSKEQLSICDQVVRIPMSGKVNSLNLSVAAGILLFAMVD
ncbi:MAG: RNA methyltransferase [Anaerolineales bacterium]